MPRSFELQALHIADRTPNIVDQQFLEVELDNFPTRHTRFDRRLTHSASYTELTVLRAVGSGKAEEFHEHPEVPRHTRARATIRTDEQDREGCHVYGIFIGGRRRWQGLASSR